MKRASFNGTSALFDHRPRKVDQRYDAAGTYEAAFSLSLAGNPPRPFPARPSRYSLPSPWPSALQALNSSHSVSSPSSTVRLPSTLAASPRAHRSPVSPLTPAYRRVLCPLRRMHQGPMPQAKAKGGRKPPPHRNFGHPFHPHYLGSYLLVYVTPFGPPFIPSYHSMRSSM